MAVAMLGKDLEVLFTLAIQSQTFSRILTIISPLSINHNYSPATTFPLFTAQLFNHSTSRPLQRTSLKTELDPAWQSFF